MKRKFTLFFIIAIAAVTVNAQIVITPDTNTAQLVNNFILSGVTASNIAYTGADSALGAFTNGNSTNLGLSNGIVLSTGQVTTIDDLVLGFASNSNGTPGDYDLEALLTGYTTYDASVLEFDLVPAGNVLEFQYVFGSEEYPEFVGSAFNDVFGFFINGANPSGGNYLDTNIAIIPGTIMPVAINNVNAVDNSSYFVDNQALNGTTIVFDGFTTVLLAQIYVIPATTYHLKMAIADVSDGVFDSGIFLKAQSMKSYNGSTGIKEIQNGSFAFYPNPVNDKIEIAVQGKAEVEFLNAEGQLIKGMSLDMNHNTIDISSFVKGIYFIKVMTDQGVSVKKFIKA